MFKLKKSITIKTNSCAPVPVSANIHTSINLISSRGCLRVFQFVLYIRQRDIQDFRRIQFRAVPGWYINGLNRAISSSPCFECWFKLVCTDERTNRNLTREFKPQLQSFTDMKTNSPTLLQLHATYHTILQYLICSI